jgi:hypothetical protein
MSAAPSESNEPKKVTGSTPFAGCLIMVLAMLVLMFLVGFAIWSVFRLDAEIGKFTQPDAKPVALATTEGAEADLNALKARLDAFGHQLSTKDGGDARLALSAADINLAIAAFEPLKELRGTFHVESIGADSLRVAICFKMHAKPLDNSFRYLNGTMVVRPELVEGEILLRVDSVDAGPQPVPAEFLEHLSPYRISQRYVTDPTLGPALKSLTGVALRPGEIELRRLTSENPPAPVTEAQAQRGKMRFLKLFGFIAATFLVGVAAVLLVGLRSSRRKARQDESQGHE